MDSNKIKSRKIQKTTNKVNSLRSAVKFVSLILIFTFGFLFGSNRDLSAANALDKLQVSTAAGTPAEDINLDTLWQAWSLLESKFVTTQNEPDLEVKIQGLIDGLAESYGDPYTEYFTPEELASFNENVDGGSFGGVGMEVGETDGGLIRVVAPLRDSPAQKAGIMSGDVILSIDGINVLNSSVDEAINLIRGEVGTEVELTLARESEREPLVVTVIRDDIQIPVLQTQINDGVFIIEIYTFSADLPNRFRQALREYSESGATGLIIDVRNNPGGYLNSAIELGSWFADAGEILLREKSERLGESDEKLFRSKGYELGILNERPIVVLVNQGSASASEILAGILQDYDLAEIVGEQTFGKGSVQELIPLQDGSAIKITTSRWFTPKGSSISEGGLTPDVVISDDPETAEVDEQVVAAIEILTNN